MITPAGIRNPVASYSQMEVKHTNHYTTGVSVFLLAGYDDNTNLIWQEALNGFIQ